MTTEQERHEELLKDSTQYCCYCGDVKHSFQCCGENHFESYSEMDTQRQKEFMSYEEFDV